MNNSKMKKNSSASTGVFQSNYYETNDEEYSSYVKEHTGWAVQQLSSDSQICEQKKHGRFDDE